MKKLADLKERLKTPRGILYLFAATFAAAVLLAVFISLQLDFFEGYAMEKFRPAPSSLVRLLKEAGQNQDRTPIDSLHQEEKRLLYSAWMSDRSRFAEAVPRLMTNSDPVLYRELIKKTMAVGNEAQRLEALVFVRQAGPAQFPGVIDFARQKAEKRGEAKIIDYIGNELAAF